MPRTKRYSRNWKSPHNVPVQVVFNSWSLTLGSNVALFSGLKVQSYSYSLWGQTIIMAVSKQRCFFFFPYTLLATEVQYCIFCIKKKIKSYHLLKLLCEFVQCEKLKPEYVYYNYSYLLCSLFLPNIVLIDYQ